MAQKPSASERMQTAFFNLSNSATSLNQASDELSIVVSTLDDSLRKLNLGIAAWVKITGNDEPNGDYWSRDVGYAKVGSTWRIAIRKVTGNFNSPEDDDAEEWPFSEAPRWMRIDAVDKLPELIEKLVERADKTTEKLRKKTEVAVELASAIGEATTTAKAKSA